MCVKCYILKKTLAVKWPTAGLLWACVQLLLSSHFPHFPAFSAFVSGFFFLPWLSSCHAPGSCRSKVWQTAPPAMIPLLKSHVTLWAPPQHLWLSGYFSTCNDSLRISISTPKPGRLNLKRAQTNMIIVSKRPAVWHTWFFISVSFFPFLYFIPPSSLKSCGCSPYGPEI